MPFSFKPKNIVSGGIFKTRFDDHLSRKFFHMASGTAVAFVYAYWLTREQAIIAVIVAAALLIPFDIARLSFPKLNALIIRYWGFLMREDEREKPSAQLYYLLGLMWCAFFLPKTIAIQGVLTLAWMDPVAAVFGVRYGKHTWNSIFQKVFVDIRRLPASLGAKTVEGSLAGFLAAFLAGVLAWTGPWASYAFSDHVWWPSASLILVLSTLGGVSAVVAEAWPSQWDDNANIPFWLGLCVWAFALILGVPL